MNKTILVVLFLSFAFPIHALFAVDESGSCARFSTPQEFVKSAVALCLSEPPSKRSDCMKDASQIYSDCGYKGSFTRLSARVQTQILVLSLFRNLVTSPVANRQASDNTTKELKTDRKS